MDSKDKFCSNCGKMGHLVGQCAQPKKKKPALPKTFTDGAETLIKEGLIVVNDCPVCAARREKERVRKQKYRERSKQRCHTAM